MLDEVIAGQSCGAAEAPGRFCRFAFRIMIKVLILRDAALARRSSG
jgi:hypothetical protein